MKPWQPYKYKYQTGDKDPRAGEDSLEGFQQEDSLEGFHKGSVLAVASTLPLCQGKDHRQTMAS